ncbi:hypothetical protein TNCV_4241391 [Trichonephila clavipes]|nr:hypothetical protein TNCV_4241391 [Trichonephila clavipes]
MYARTTPTRHGLADMFKNTRSFTDHSSSDGYSGHQIHFRFDGHVINRDSERSMFRQVLMHPSECLMIRLMPRTATCPFLLAGPQLKWISVNSTFV